MEHCFGLQEWDYTVLTVADPLTRVLELAESVRISTPQAVSSRCNVASHDKAKKSHLLPFLIRYTHHGERPISSSFGDPLHSWGVRQTPWCQMLGMQRGGPLAIKPGSLR